MKQKNALVVLADGYEDIEATAPIDILRRAGVQVTVAGLEKKTILSSHRMTVVCDAEFSKVMDREWDVLVLPGGGKGSQNLSESEDVVCTAVRLFGEGKLVCAICAAPAVVLGKSGILEGKKVTCYPGMEKTCPDIVFHTEERVITDGNLITAKGAGTALEFAFAIVEYLYGNGFASTLKEKVIF